MQNVFTPYSIFIMSPQDEVIQQAFSGRVLYGQITLQFDDIVEKGVSWG